MGLVEDVILVQTWHAFGHRGGDLSCILCEGATDMYALPNEDGAEMLVDAGLRVLCLECAADNDIEGKVGERITIETSIRRRN